MPAKLAAKAVVWAVMNPESTGKAILVAFVIAVFPLFILAAPFVLFISVPLVEQPTIDLYREVTEEAVLAFPEGYYGPPGIEWEAVLALDAVLRLQDFSRVTLEDVEKLASMFVEVVETRERKVFVGYRTIYDEEGQPAGSEPVYEIRLLPVYKTRTLSEMGGHLGLSFEQIRWAETMLEGLRAKRGGKGIGRLDDISIGSCSHVPRRSTGSDGRTGRGVV